MKSPFHVAARGIALALLLLGGCLSNPEPPTPTNTTQTDILDIPALKKAFLDRHYDAKLVQQVNNLNQPDSYWTWTPLWEKAAQTTVPDSATYTYVPLEARVAVRPYVVSLVGVRKYLRFKQTPRGLSFAEAAYIFKEKSTDAVLPQPPHAFFAAFTGMLLVKDFATGETADFAFKDGVRQPYPAVRSGKGNNRTAACYTTVTCDWTGTCATEPENTPVYATSTYGLGFCGTPGDDGVGCSRIVWVLTRTNSENHCSPDGSGDPGGDPNGGGCTNCGTGPTGPTPPTNLNSPCGKMYTLNTKSGFQTAVTQLKQPSILTGNHEVGFIYTGNGSNFANYSSMSGTNGQIIFQPPYPIDGDMHVHNLYANDSQDKALPIPSPTDIVDIYTLWNGGNMINDGTFTSTVITAFGDVYSIKISNSADFQSFGSQFLKRIGIIDDFFFGPDGPYPLQEGTASMSGQSAFKVSNEVNLLKFLKNERTGLVLLKYDPASSTWFQRSLDNNNNPLNDPCQ